MALNLFNTFQPRINPPDASYPSGSIKDETIPGTSNDGTLLQAIWANDWQGFSDALLAAGGLSPDNLADTVTASQRFTALMNVMGLTPISGGGTLEIGKRYLFLDSLTYTLPSTTGLTQGKSIGLYRLGGAVEPTLQVEGSNSEMIDYFDPVTGVLLQTDTSVLFNIFAPIIIIFNTNWEV